MSDSGHNYTFGGFNWPKPKTLTVEELSELFDEVEGCIDPECDCHDDE